MAKRLNKNLVVGLSIAGMAVTTAGMIILIAFLPARKPEPLAEQARKAEADGSYQQAMLAYHQAAERARRADYPLEEVHKYKILAGEMAQKAGRPGDALAIWGGVLRENASSLSAQEHIVKALLDLPNQGYRIDWEQLHQEATKDPIKDTPLGMAAAGLSLVNRRSVNAGNVAEGRQLLEKAFAADRSDPDLARYLGEYHLEEAGQVLRGPRPQDQLQRVDEHLQAAEKVYQELIEALPDDPARASKAWRYRGVFYLQLRHYSWQRLGQAKRGEMGTGTEPLLTQRIAEADQSSLSSIEQAIRLAPEDDRVLQADNHCALGYYWLNKMPVEEDEKSLKAERDSYYEKGVGAYHEAIKLAPDEFDAYNQLSRFYQSQNKISEAAELLEDRLARGVKAGSNARYRREMLELRKATFELRRLQAETLPVADKQRAELIERLTTLQNEYKNEAPGAGENPVSNLMLAQIRILQNRLDDALPLADKAHKSAATTDPQTQLRIKHTLANLCLSKNLANDAEKLLNEMLQIQPDNAAIYRLLAIAQSQAGRLELAEKNAQTAVQKNPEDRTSKAVLAEIFQKQGKFHQANVMLESLGATVTDTMRSLQEATALLRAPSIGEEPPPENVRKAMDILRGVLQKEPDNLAALSQTVLRLGDEARNDPSRLEENKRQISELLAGALQAVEKKRAEAPETAPAGQQTAGGYQQRVNEIRRLEILADPQASAEDITVAMAAEISRQVEDPYERAVNLYALYHRWGKYKEAMEQLESALAREPEKANLLGLHFDLSLRLQDWARAQTSMEKLIKIEPGPAGGRFLRGRWQVAQAEAAQLEGRTAEAAAFAAKARDELEAALREYPKSPDGRVYLAQALLFQRDQDGAHRELNAALELNPRHFRALIAMYQMAQIRQDEALRIQLLHRLQAVAPGNPFVQKEAQELEDIRNPQASIAKREKHLQSNEKDLGNLFALAGLYATTGQNDKARAAFEKCRELAPDNLEIVGLYARFLRDKKPPEAEAAQQLLQATIQNMTDLANKAKAQIMLAGHMEEQARRAGNDAAALGAAGAAFEAAARIQESPEVMLDVGLFYARAGQSQEAEAKFRRAIELSTSDETRERQRQARRLLIGILLPLDAHRASDLDAELTAYEQKFAADGFADDVRSTRAYNRGNVTEALAYVDESLKKNPQSVDGWRKRGLLQYQRGALTAAIEDCRRAVSLDPRAINYEHRILLAKCLEESKQVDLAIAELQSVLNEDREAAQVARELADLYLRLERYSNAEAIVLPRARDPRTPGRPAWLNMLATVYARQQDLRKAVLAAREAADLAMSPASVTTYAELCLRANSPRDVIDFVTQRVPSQIAGNFMVQLRLGEAYALDGRQEQSIQVFNHLLDSAQSDAGFYRMIVTSMHQHLKNEKAKALIKARLEANPKDWKSQYGMAVLIGMGGDNAGAYQAMESLLAQLSSEDPTLRSLKATMLLDLTKITHGAKDYERARNLYERLLEVDPTAYMGRNNLAYLLLTDLNEPQKALEHAELAVRNMPPTTHPGDRAIVLDTLGWALVATGDPANGIMRLRQAIQSLQACGTGHDDHLMAGLYYHLAEGLHRRAQTASGSAAETDLKDAAQACQRSYQLLKGSGKPDVDHTGDSLNKLAAKLKITLEEPPATQAASIK